ncbi:hypothetical protein K3495_g15745, partial [Podosphaera aphanis]
EGSMLAHFDPGRQTVLETDASDFVTAAVLSQYDTSGVLRPVAFMSKKMLPAECNYDIYDKELLAIVNSFETWTAELGSVNSSTLVLTDHKNLEYFTTTKKLNRRQARWNELLSEYDFKIVFRPGKSSGKPDALTRISSDKPSTNEDTIKSMSQLYFANLFYNNSTTLLSTATGDRLHCIVYSPGNIGGLIATPTQRNMHVGVKAAREITPPPKSHMVFYSPYLPQNPHFAISLWTL